MQLGAIIFSRMLSTRLPSKSLKLINGKPLFERVLDRLYKLDRIDHICLATTINTEDDVLCDLAKNLKVDVFRGSENNLISRAIDASEFFGYKNVIRVCGDRPFFSFSHIDSIISNFNLKNQIKFDLISNNKKKKLVDQGLTIEIISSNSLKKLKLKKDLTKYNLENITSYYYQNYKKFNINHLKSPKNWFLKNKYTIDDKNDLKKMRRIISKVGYNNFDIEMANKIIRKF